MSAPPVRHSLIINHPSRALVLLVRSADGYALPTVLTEDRHTAEVDHINAAIRATFGITTTFLRSLSHGAMPADPVDRCHELVARDDVALTAGEWCDPSTVPELIPAAAAHEPKDGRDWERAAWWGEATEWISRGLGALGQSVTDIVQLRVWPSSAVLRVRASEEHFYFKAVARSIGHECALTAYLAEHFAGVVPPLVALDLERRWLLMRAVAGRKLEEIDAIASWQWSARMYGQLQVASRQHTHALRARGANVRDMDQLIRGLAALADEHESLRDFLPALRARAVELAAYDIPLLLEHGDLWPGNFLVDGDRSVLIDWETATIGHPFFSVAPLLVGLREYQPTLAGRDTTELLLSAYLEAFSPLGTPTRLRTALDLALPLAFCDMALRYREQPPSVVRLHPWMRDLVPEALRRASAGLGAAT